ncbi:hypothetical protein BDR03DRAFT_1019603 [Suillus americanus]|nr:hypothetical protein BDR03DRAFT_1019603 [Suillus americanus]
MHNHGSRVKGPVHKTLVTKWVKARAASTSSIKDESEDEDEDEEGDGEDTEERMHEEDNIDDSLLVSADEDYEMDPSSPLGNTYTQLIFPESSPPPIPVTQHHPDSQDSRDWDVGPSHRQPSTPFAQRKVRSSTEDDSIEITAPPPSQFTKIDPKAKPALARTKTVLDPADIRVFGPQLADGRGTFAIPYGHPSIFTSVFLNMTACVIYKPLGLLICIVCEIGIATKCLSAHRQKHHDVPTLTAEQISVLEAYKLHESDSFENWDNASPVVPGIPYQDGYMCTFQGCCFATVSKQRIQAHDREHCTRNNWKSCVVQALYASMQRKYPVVVPHSPPALDAALPESQDLLAQVESFYEQHRVLHMGRLGPPMDRAHLNPFLAKYNWLDVIKDETPSDIVEWVKMPERDENELIGILPCFQCYFGEIIKLLTDENALRKTRILRAVNTTKSLYVFSSIHPFLADSSMTQP